MDSDDSQPDSHCQVPKGLLVLALALALIGAGVLILLFVLAEMLAAYRQFPDSAFLLAVRDSLQGVPVFSSSVGDFYIGAGTALTLAFFFTMLLAWTALGMAALLIRAGVQLLAPDVVRQIAGLKTRVRVLARELAKTTNRPPG